MAELAAVREQVVKVQRTIDDSMSSQEALAAIIGAGRAQQKQKNDHAESRRAMIHEYTSKVAELQGATDTGSGWTPQQEEERLSLAKRREFLSRKLEHSIQVVLVLHNDNENIAQSITETEAELNSLDAKLSKEQEELILFRSESSSEQLVKQKLETRLQELQKQIGEADAALVAGALALEESKRQATTLEAREQESRANVEEYIREIEVLVRQTNAMNLELQRTVAINSKSEAEIETKQAELETKRVEYEQLQKEVQRLKQLKTVVVNQTNNVEETKDELEARKRQLVNDITSLREGEAMSLRRECEARMKHVSQLQREKEILLKKQRTSEKATKTAAELIHLNEGAKKTLEQEVKALMETVDKHQEEIRNLLQEKDKHQHDTEMSSQHYYTALEELKLFELQTYR